jgi:acyl carrier protein
LARWRPDGTLEFLGRRDGQVKVQGVRVELGEIEANLTQHPDLGDAIVLAEQGVQGLRLVAYVIAKAGRMPTPAALAAFLQRRLPAPMVPASFVLMDRFPLTATGKVDRRALPKSAGAATGGMLRKVAPRSTLEHQLAAIWHEILNVVDIGVHDNFFELGGNSLSATRVIARVRKEIGVELPERRIFEYPTLDQLAVQIDAVRASARAREQEDLRATVTDDVRPALRLRQNDSAGFGDASHES